MGYISTIFVALAVSQVEITAGQNLCGVLYSSVEFIGDRFILEPNDSYGDLEMKSEQYPQGWHKTIAYSQTEQDCVLTMCDDLNISGNCKTQDGALDLELTGFLNVVRSVKCECLSSKAFPPTTPKPPPSSTIRPPQTFPSGSNVCGVLYSYESFRGDYLIIEPNGRYADLRMSTQQYPLGWHQTHSYSELKDHCVLRMCDGPNFGGKCIPALKLAEPTATRFIHVVRSVKCECPHSNDFPSTTSNPLLPTTHPSSLLFPSGPNVCGVLYSATDFSRSFFILESNDRYTDLQKHNRQYIPGWHDTRSYTQFKDHCVLTMCDDLDFSGNCTEASGVANPNTRKLFKTVRSAKCECWDYPEDSSTPSTEAVKIGSSYSDKECNSEDWECVTSTLKERISFLEAELEKIPLLEAELEKTKKTCE